MSVSVCLSAYWHTQMTRGRTSPNFCACYLFSYRGSVLIWRRCDMLCTSGFVDDVPFHIMAVWHVYS